MTVAPRGPSDSNPNKTRDVDPHLVKRGERIREVRIKAGIPSVNQAVLKTGINSGSLAVIENGKKDMFLTVAEKIATGYGVSLDVLVGRAPIPDVIDRYPARQSILSSPEFTSAQESVRRWFERRSPHGAENWSTLRWAREWFDVLEHWQKWRTLPPEPAADGAPDSSRRIRPR